MIKPVLDFEFKPAVIELREFNKEVIESGHSNRLIISIKRNKGYIYSREFLIFEDGYNSPVYVSLQLLSEKHLSY